MNARQKNIAKAGWELVVALCVFFGTFFMAFFEMFLSSADDKTEDGDDYVLHNNSTLISYNSDVPKIIVIKNDNE